MLANSVGSILRCLRDPVYGVGCSASFQGTLSSLNAFGNMAALLIAGYLPYAIGKKNSAVLMGSCEYIGLFLIIFTGNPVLLAVAFALCGLGRGTISNVTNVIVGECTENKTAGLNLLHATFAVGAVLSPLAFALIDISKWKIPVAITAVLLVFAFVLMSTSTLSNAKTLKIEQSSEFPKEFRFWNNVIILFFYLSAETSLMSYIVSYFSYNGIFSDAVSNVMSSVLWLSILTGRLAVAFVSKKAKKIRIIFILGAFMFVSLVLMLVSKSKILSAVSVAMLGLSMSGIYPTTLSTQDDKYNKSTSATGICLSAATMGSIIYPSIAGFISDRYGYSSGMKSLLVPVVLMFVFIIIKALRERRA